MKPCKHIFVLLLIILIFFTNTSCKKENEPSFPVIEITQPVENQIFNSGDTVVIIGNVSHDKPITKVSVAVVNLNLIPVTARYNLIAQGVNYSINTNIIIDNVALESGNYYLHVKASDGIVETNNYTKIFIYEAPLRLEKYILITKSSPGILTIHELDTALEATFLATINSDYGYSQADGLNKLLYLSGKFSSRIYAYNYDTQTMTWQNMVQGYAPLPYFQDIKLFENKIYTSIRQNKINAYNNSGALVYNLSTGTERYPDKLHFHNQFIITSQYSLSGQNSYITSYFRESGGFYQTLQTTFNIIKFISRDNNNIYVFANDQNNNAQMRIYDMDYNGVWEPYSLSTGKIITAEKIDNNTILIAYEDKILKYTYNPNGAVAYINNINPVSLKYESTHQKVVVGTKDKRILIYDYPNPVLLKQIILNDSICDILPVYNK